MLHWIWSSQDIVKCSETIVIVVETVTVFFNHHEVIYEKLLPRGFFTIYFHVVPSQSHNKSKMSKDVMVIHEDCGVVLWHCNVVSFLRCLVVFLRFRPSMFIHF